MGKRVKWALLTMLGFATACSTVKNTSKAGDMNGDKDSIKVETPDRQIRLMYGVRPPEPLEETAPEMKTEEAPQTSEVPATPETGN